MKKILLPMIVLAVGVGTSAFTSMPKKTTTAARWFLFSGTYDASHLENASNYGSPTDTKPCDASGALCAVLYEPDSGDPGRPANFDSQMVGKIDSFVNDETPDNAMAQQQ